MYQISVTSYKTLTGRTWAVRGDGRHWNLWLWVTGSEGWEGEMGSHR